MMDLPLLYQRVEALEAELGSITAFILVQSKEASKTVRDCTKITDSLSIELRRSLVDFDKSLTTQEN